MEHALSVLVENKPGVLSRITGLFARRGFNIDSLAVGETENPLFSRITITVDGSDQPVEHVTKQLHKLISVIKISDLEPAERLERELLLVKVKATAENRAEIMQVAEIFEARIVDISPVTAVIEATGPRHKVEAFIELLRSMNVMVELIRTGRVAVRRGPKLT